MLFHLTVKIVGRAKGMDATAAAAYITRSKIEDRTTGETFDHTHHKDKAMFAERYLPKEHPDFAELKKDKKGNPIFGELWNLVEENEKRKDSQFARNFNLAFQDEFTDEENKECLEKWIEENFTSRGIIVDAAGHYPHMEEDGSNNKNKHGHVLATIRQVTKDGWNPKKDREANSKEFLNQLRKSWADINNEVFERKFIVKHQTEYDELEEVLQDILPDKEERNHEKVQLLYDKYPEEWLYISDKTLDEQRAEVEEWLEDEEEKESLNMERISRLEKKFLSIPFEAQRHVGAKAKAMQRKGKQTDRKAYDSDPMRKNREVEAELNAVTVSDEELEAELSKEPVYKSLADAKAAILKQSSENIYDSEEVQMIQKQVDAIKSLDEMNQWLKTVWKPIKARIESAAQRNAAFDDIMSENSVIKETYKSAQQEVTDVKRQMSIIERQQSLIEFSNTEKGRGFSDSENQETELSETIKEMSLFSMMKEKVKDTFKQALSFIKEKSIEIIEKSPLRKFKIFRAQREIVENNKFYKLQTEEIADGRYGSGNGDSGRNGNSFGQGGQSFDFNTGFEEYSSNVDSERAQRAIEEHERRAREAAEQERKRVADEQRRSREASERTRKEIQRRDKQISNQSRDSGNEIENGNSGGRGR